MAAANFPEKCTVKLTNIYCYTPNMCNVTRKYLSQTAVPYRGER